MSEEQHGVREMHPVTFFDRGEEPMEGVKDLRPKRLYQDAIDAEAAAAAAREAEDVDLPFPSRRAKG